MGNKTSDTPFNIHVTGRHVHVTEAMKSHVIDKLSKLEKFNEKIIEVHVTMDIQKLDHKIVIVMKFDHFKIKVQAISPDMYASIDKAVTKLQARIVKYKDRIKVHQAKGLHVVDMNVNVLKSPEDEAIDELNDSIEDENRRRLEDQFQMGSIVRTESRPLKILTYEEALMKMELSMDHFLVFKNEEDLKLRVIYRREDGNYGVIEPE